jgi:hypothetical protein
MPSTDKKSLSKAKNFESKKKSQPKSKKINQELKMVK